MSERSDPLSQLKSIASAAWIGLIAIWAAALIVLVSFLVRAEFQPAPDPIWQFAGIGPGAFCTAPCTGLGDLHRSVQSVGLAHLALWFWGTRSVERLFRLYAQGRIFEVANARCLQHLGASLLLWGTLATPGGLLPTLPRLVSTGSGPLQLAPRIESPEPFVTIFVGMLFGMVGFVSAKGAELEREVELTV